MDMGSRDVWESKVTKIDKKARRCSKNELSECDGILWTVFAYGSTEPRSIGCLKFEEALKNKPIQLIFGTSPVLGTEFYVEFEYRMRIFLGRVAGRVD